MSSDAVYLSCRPSSHHAPSRSLIGAVFRYARRTSLGLAGRIVWRQAPPSFKCSPGGAPGFFSSPFAGLFPRMGELIHFWKLGPTCRFARRASAPINFRRGDSITEAIESRNAVAFDFWALTPICDPHLPAQTSQKIDPALGFASCRVCRTRCCAHD